MPLQPLNIAPGIRREGTQYSEEGRWFNCDKVRFNGPWPEKIGGWVRAVETTVVGVGRLLYNWITLAGDNVMAIGTSKKFYVEIDSVVSDVTPIRRTQIRANPFTTGAPGSTLVLVTDAGHGAAAGDYVTVSGSAAVDGIPDTELNAEHVVLDPVTANTYYIQVTTGCTAGAVVGGGAAVTFAYQIAIGLENNFEGSAWGSGAWSSGAWGLLSKPTLILVRLWSADNWGEDLLFTYRGGTPYLWDATNPTTRAVAVSTLGGAADVPTEVLTLLVTEDRHAVAVGSTVVGGGALDPLLIRWSDQEDYANWTAAVTNTAGSVRIPLGSLAVGACQTRQETLIWTDRSLHSLQFVGPPYTFSLTTLAENVSVAGPNAMVNANGITFWMGLDKFWMYDGRVQQIPCDVQTFVFNDFDRGQAPQVWAGSTNRFNEVIWFYPSFETSVVDRYVIYNYEDKTWAIGSHDRTVWLDCPVREGYPYSLAGGYDSTACSMFIQEIGNDDGSTNPETAIDAWIETADLDIGDGERVMFVDRIIPDLDFSLSSAAVPSIAITVTPKKFPGGDDQTSKSKTVITESPMNQNRFTQDLWVRLRGRALRFKFQSTAAGVGWLLGKMRINARTDGRQ